VVEELVDALQEVFRCDFSNSTVPMLEPAIGVGSTFEGWSLCHDDAVYQILLPLKAPRVHVFHLEMGAARQMPAEDPCIRVELECTCTGQQREENSLCLFHHSLKEMTENQDPSFLHSFCTGVYLDVQKTASWFQTFVMSAWTKLWFSSYNSMKILPCSRSCKLQVSNNRSATLFIEFIFGVQHGDSDIFLSSQAPEDTVTPNTRWPVSFAVAELKFFRHVARQAPTNHVYLKCLRTLVHKLVGRSFSTHTIKTIVMHVLTSAGQSRWNMKRFEPWMQDIIGYLRCCLDKKRLDHFFIGNENMPEDIILPLEYRTAEPLNLFQHLKHDLDAHARAICELKE
ncbi:IPIL1 protein, partial [Piaya cayana]|nr:IPIL1 protein [Piaya cayana]